MSAWNFTLAVVKNEDNSEFDGYVYRDGVVSVRSMNRTWLIDYEVNADGFITAVEKAEQEIVADGGRVIGLEPDDLVSLQEMAHESGLGWGRMHTLANANDIDPMPLPINRMSSEKPLWSWREVSAWLAKRGFISQHIAKVAADAQAINQEIKLRNQSRDA